MDVSSSIKLFGTTQPIAPVQHLSAGAITADFVKGGLTNICFGKTELIRAISYLVRDEDWGTIVPEISDVSISDAEDSFAVSYIAQYENNGSILNVSISIEAENQHLEFMATARPEGNFVTNRAGFTVLHPLEVSGEDVSVEYVSGEVHRTQFPMLLEPWQVFKGIRSLSHELDGVSVDCLLGGDVFEMEDQRNWSDASFKTYSRPLALDWPYVLTIQKPNQQVASLSFSGQCAKPRSDDERVIISSEPTSECMFPKAALEMMPFEAREALDHLEILREVSPQRIACHLDLQSGNLQTSVEAFAQLQEKFVAEYSLDYVVQAEGDLAIEFRTLAEAIDAAGLKFSSLMVCPSVDRQSTPPGSTWPECPELELIYIAARTAFPDILLGGGMLTYFTELNRKRPPLGLLDFVAHGTNPIVHAADDESVMQTLSSLAYITKSTWNIIGDRKYHLGLSSISMRHNPYGSKTMENPENNRTCMASYDPRQFAQFGAAYTAGYAASIAEAGVDYWTPSAFSGPCGIVTKNSKLTPMGEIIREMANMAGTTVFKSKNSHPSEIAALFVGSRKILANLTPNPKTVILDDKLDIRLEPYEVRFLS